MKLFFGLFGCMLFMSMLTSCKGDGTRVILTKADTTAIYEYVKMQMGGDTIKPQKNLFALDDDAPIDLRVALNYHHLYLDHPLPLCSSKDTSKKVRYFGVDFEDIDGLQKAMKDSFGGLRIYLGYDTKYYRLIMVGVNKYTNANYLKDQKMYDDFTPCPNACIEDDPREMVRKTDLNWDGKIFRQPK